MQVKMITVRSDPPDPIHQAILEEMIVRGFEIVEAAPTHNHVQYLLVNSNT